MDSISSKVKMVDFSLYSVSSFPTSFLWFMRDDNAKTDTSRRRLLFISSFFFFGVDDGGGFAFILSCFSWHLVHETASIYLFFPQMIDNVF